MKQWFTIHNLSFWNSLFFTTCLVMFLGNPLIGQNIITASVDSTRIFVGDQLNFKLNANLPLGSTFRENADAIFDTLSNIEVLNNGKWDTLSQQNQLQLQRTFTITSLDSGYYWIPKITFTYNDNKGSKKAFTERIPIIVDNVPIGMTIKPNKGIIKEGLTFADFLPFILGILGLLALLYLARFIYKKRNKVEEVVEAPPVIIPAHEIALDKLDALKNKKLWQQGEIKAYQSELTYIVREYLENRYDIQALESTSDEIIDELKKADVPNDHQDNLIDMFTMADMVKFAKAKPPVDANDKLMQSAEQFIIKTKRKALVNEVPETDTSDTAS